MLFDLKSIVSNILFYTYRKNKKEILGAIEKAILSCPVVL